MVKQFIVSTDRRKTRQDRFPKGRLFCDSLFYWILIPALILIAAQVGLQKVTSFDDLVGYVNLNERHDYRITNTLLVSCLFIIIIVSLRVQPKQERGAALFIYPFGIQLASVYFGSSVEDNSHGFHTIKHGSFLPRDEIIDCVVNEVILAHKVVSVILFRLKKSISCSHSDRCENSNHARCDALLVEAFPGIEMSYNKCLILRQQIMKEIDVKKSYS